MLYASLAFSLIGKGKKLAALCRKFSRLFLGLGKTVPNFLVYSLCGDNYPMRWNRRIRTMKAKYMLYENEENEIFDTEVEETTTSTIRTDLNITEKFLSQNGTILVKLFNMLNRARDDQGNRITLSYFQRKNLIRTNNAELSQKIN